MNKPKKIFFTNEEDTTHLVSTDDWFDDEEEITISGTAVVYCVACGCILAMLALTFCIIYFH